MSTWEKWTDVVGSCPCGAGRILRHVESPDNPYSKTTSSLEIECETCVRTWRLEAFSEVLVNIASEAEYKQASPKSSATHQTLRREVAAIVDRYFSGLALTTKKAEYAELTRLGLTSISYRDFTAARRAQSIGQIAKILTGSETWYHERGAEYGTITEYERARTEYLAAKSNESAAYHRIIRRPAAGR